MYKLDTRDGYLEIPNGTIIEYKGLEIVGQDKEYWNRPIQQNFIDIAEKLSEIDETIATLDSSGNTPAPTPQLGGGAVALVEYNTDGTTKKIIYSDGFKSEFFYTDNLVSSIKHFDAADAVIKTATMTYNEFGQLVSHT